MDIVINAVGMPFNGETVKTRSLGGSESAAYYLARGLAERGHRVTVFTTTEAEGDWDGVQYVNAGPLTAEAPLGERFTFYAINTPHDVLICQRHPLAFHKDYASKINIWQLHDLALHRTAGMVQGGLPRIDFVTAVSAFHAKQVEELYGLKAGTVHVVPNGVDLALYEPPLSAFFGPEAHGQFRLLYQSRPERGLEHLVRPGGIMDRLRGSRAHLYVCGYDNTTQTMAPVYEQLYTWARALPNVTLLGALAKPDLARLQKSCDLLCYPTSFEEVSCITAMEAMAAHLPMLTSYHAALPETCKDTGTILIPLKNGQVDEDAFVRNIHDLIADADDAERSGSSQLASLIEAQITAAPRVSWERATGVLERQIEEQFKFRSNNPDRVLRHCIEHSDIGFMDWYVERHFIDDRKYPISANSLRERREMFTFIDSDEEMLEHYEHFEGVNCERMERDGLNIEAEIDGLQRTTRFRGIVSALAEVLAGRTESKVFEFGCAHGHITLALAKMFPTVTFVGMDFMGRSVGLAIKYAKQLGVSNVSFSRGSLADVSLGEFDVVIAAEVIEHIYDYHDAIDTLRTALVPGGSMIFTTPTGRWEWSGHDAFKNGREHLHHFERDDWRDILKDHPRNVIRYAPFAPEDSNALRGSWVVHVTPEEGRTFGHVNYERKLSVLAPRQTISACIIACNAENNIGKALVSIAGWVDEIVIAMDPASSDGTEAAVARVQAQFPWTPIRIIKGTRALEEGFAAARNRTVKAATGDWVLWMDADEECPQINNAWRLLRPSPLNAYACPQIHYSAQPAQVLTTDYPARLFRNHRGVRFYGLVHEHPEDAPGKSVTPAAMITDIQFLHNGYVDERTRRLRYQRNLPLLLRDVKENPDRLLNKFLLLRDIAQGIGFDRMTGAPPQAHIENAMHGVALMHEMIAREDIPLRMVLDGMQYYSICTEALGTGFVAKVTWNTGKPPLDMLNTSGSFDARFHDRATYLKLLQRIAEETTKHYESQYV